MAEAKKFRNTASVCPVCFKKISALLLAKEDGVYMEKECPTHGSFSEIVWRNNGDISDWYGDAQPLEEGELKNCPADCANGLCAEHKNDTCCVVLEVTERCSLHCTYCFADGGSAEPSLMELRSQMKTFVRPGKTLVQLSGGEPTMREDLCEIVSSAKELGCKYVQLNSNGIRLAEDEGLAARLAEAGLSFVFLQFDGLDDEAYTKLRGRPLAEIKKKAIANCALHNLGVTLVSTVVRGVNDHLIGDILRYEVQLSPAVRGVHFQPVAHIGRLPHLPCDSDRFTLDELMAEVESQSCGLVHRENLLPSKCDHPMCGFHGDFIVLEDGSLYPITQKREDAPCCCCGSKSPADSNREFVGRRWQRADDNKNSCCCGSDSHDIHDLDYFGKRLKSHGFTVTSMAFQDAGILDIERLSRCSLHVFKDGRLRPFCANYLTPWK